MNEQELGKKIAELLDVGASENIKQSTLYRLQSARRLALENCQSSYEIINSGNGTSAFSEHDQHHFHTGKLILLLIMLFAFALVSATYWQFLEKGKSAVEATVLIDDKSSSAVLDNEHEASGESSIETYIDNVLQLVDDLSTDDQIDNGSEQDDDVPTDAYVTDEAISEDDGSLDTRSNDEFDLNIDSQSKEHIDNELEESLVIQ
ncbi:MAG: DUF3619 family protein [Nitrosomonas sp.]|nr:MAG: DUF3619 family protein [Nitrosomonas sp.]